MFVRRKKSLIPKSPTLMQQQQSPVLPIHHPSFSTSPILTFLKSIYIPFLKQIFLTSPSFFIVAEK